MKENMGILFSEHEAVSQGKENPVTENKRYITTNVCVRV